MKEKIRRRNRVVDTAVFAVLLFAVSAVTLALFYWQTTGSTAGYHSDMEAYILEMQGLNEKYSFPYPVFFKLGALIHLLAPPELSVAIAAMLLNSLAMVVAKLALNRLTLGELEDGIREWQLGRKYDGGNFTGSPVQGKDALGKSAGESRRRGANRRAGHWKEKSCRKSPWKFWRVRRCELVGGRTGQSGDLVSVFYIHAVSAPGNLFAWNSISLFRGVFAQSFSQRHLYGSQALCNFGLLLVCQVIACV